MANLFRLLIRLYKFQISVPFLVSWQAAFFFLLTLGENKRWLVSWPSNEILPK